MFSCFIRTQWCDGRTDGQTDGKSGLRRSVNWLFDIVIDVIRRRCDVALMGRVGESGIICKLLRISRLGACR